MFNMSVNKEVGSHTFSRKVWVAISSPFQVNFFHPLILRLRKSLDVLITARGDDRVLSMLKTKGLDCVPVGKSEGGPPNERLVAYAKTMEELVPIVQREKPDLLLTERWPEAVRVAFGFGVPSWTLFCDERDSHVNCTVFPLSTKIFASRFHGFKELQENGVNDVRKVIWFDGFPACYLKGAVMKGCDPFKAEGLKSPVWLVRPEPESAGGSGESKIVERSVHMLTKQKEAKDISLVVLPRNERQMVQYKRYPVTVMTSVVPDSPVVYADAVFGGSESMLMEAFVLGKPAVSSIYWRESKLLRELHRYIPHTLDPSQIAQEVIKFTNSEEALLFKERTRLMVNQMDDPVVMMEEEVSRFYGLVQFNDVGSSGRRSKIEIYTDILQEIAFRPRRLTHIMQAANLPYTQLKRYLIRLKRTNLVVEKRDRPNGVSYQATSEGLRFLKEYKKVISSLLE